MLFRSNFLFLFLSLISASASAWTFYWRPGGEIPIVVEGSAGVYCLPVGTQPGDIAVFGNRIMVVKTIQSLSPKCTNSTSSTGVTLESNSAADDFEKVLPRINIPDGYKNQPITADQRKNYYLLMALDLKLDVGISLLAIDKSLVAVDPNQYAATTMPRIHSVLESPRASEISKLVINGVPAWRNEVTGKLKNHNISVTYLQTLYEGKNQFVLARSWTAANSYDSQKPNFENIASTVANLGDVGSTATQKVQPSQTSNTGSQKNMSAPTGPGSVERLATLKEMLDRGLITKKEYEAKKAEILKTM